MHYIVFLDTNIFDASNYNFHNELFTKLYDYVNRGIIELQISSVVKGEVSRHIYDKVKKRIEERCVNDPNLFDKMYLYSHLFSLDKHSTEGQRKMLKK